MSRTLSIPDHKTLLSEIPINYTLEGVARWDDGRMRVKAAYPHVHGNTIRIRWYEICSHLSIPSGQSKSVKIDIKNSDYVISTGINSILSKDPLYTSAKILENKKFNLKMINYFVNML